MSVSLHRAFAFSLSSVKSAEVNFTLSLLNHDSPMRTVTRSARRKFRPYHMFTKSSYGFGWGQFALREAVCAPRSGYVLDDDAIIITCTIEVISGHDNELIEERKT